MEWVNFGGGHHITRPDYQVDDLVRLLRDFRARHGVEVYLEPGEAIALGAGVLVAEVLDMPCATACRSRSSTPRRPATCPTCSRCRTAPRIIDAGEPGALAHTYRLGGQTCLAGDVIGDYSFAAPLRVGSRLVFDDMAHYTMVKTTTFNGVRAAVDRAVELRDRRARDRARVRLRGVQGAAVVKRARARPAHLRFLGTEVDDVAPEAARFHVLPVPYEKTVSYGSGTAKGPAAILEASGQLERWDGRSDPGAEGIYTWPAIDCKPKAEKVIATIAASVARILAMGKMPVVLGGEHTVTGGVIRGYLDAGVRDFGVVQIDAHADLRDRYDGDPLSHASVMRRVVEAGIPLFQLGNRAYSRRGA